MKQTTAPAGSIRPNRTTTETLEQPGDVQFTINALDRTRPFLLLHGGAGRGSMVGFANLLAERTHSRVFVPTHPGFSGTPRPEYLSTTRELAAAYVRLIEHLDLGDVTLIGNSFGGWLAAEIALLGSPRVSGAVLVDAIGVANPEHPMADVRGMPPSDIVALSFDDPSKAPAPGAGPNSDLPTLASYAGPDMTDPTLAKRLGALDIPVHVIWGESDRIVDSDYGRSYAAAIPTSTFTLLPCTGHLPQVETPEELLGAILDLGA